MRCALIIFSLATILVSVSHAQYSTTPLPFPGRIPPNPPLPPRYPGQYNRDYARYNPDYYGRRYGILRQNHEQNIDGSYRYNYDTENGISVAEEGHPENRGPAGVAEVVQGQFSYTAPDGTPIVVQYVADENGFQARGNHLPTPPPIPPEIQRALAYNAAHPEEDRGDFSDGRGPSYYNDNYNNNNNYNRYNNYNNFRNPVRRV